MRIATWNINSVRLRLDLLKKLVEEQNPDIICLQETKVEDLLFPADGIRQMGFEHIYFAGQKSYNGVAILSKFALADVQSRDFIGTGEQRHIMANLPDGTVLHNFYVPAGGDIPDPALNDKFRYKLAFVDGMRDYFSEKGQAGRKIMLMGDLNIAPHEHDVWSHKQLLDVVSHTPIEVEKLKAVIDSRKWLDLGRHGIPESQKVYSWWSYRNKDWEKSNRGRRLDHIWITPELSDAFAGISHLRDVRAWERTSDHVPVVVNLK